MNHEDHMNKNIFVFDCPGCEHDAKAIDWILAVRKYGLETANAMFPEE